ncbi:hypothetical protein FK220_018975 [Flavobacteriaceae bacterium TP-CH-4]|uniref:Lipoprotein n=1 Tax=Pelagihabitans pacificus TaxID=2696054 RepID=A0A967E8M7_9FLAO|nr:hypothetical protein [Pelagihabitans pacificus]NHF61444.1 hypothetical protein [Pelagihabitans pacificus]
MRNTILCVFSLLLFASCQIREEIRFNEDGSGSYEVGFDMSEMMKMGEGNDSLPPQAAIDTLIIFATFLEEKKDSIAQLPKAEQEKLEALRPLRFAMKMSEEENQMNIRLSYAFDKLEDISKFAEAVEAADIKELDQGVNPMEGMMPADAGGADSVPKNGMEDLFKMAESFDTEFNKKRFSRKVTEKAMADMLQKKDTTLKADDPFVDMMRFKQVYRFPFKVKNVSNPNAKILSDFKGVELEANMYEMNNDPEYFNIEVEFER